MSGVGRCPVLGLKEDEHTNLAYASQFHVCYRTGKPQSVTLEHQKNYCMGKAHTRCPIFLYGTPGKKSENKPSIAEKAVNNSNNLKQYLKIGTRSYWDLLGFILFALIFFVGWWAYVNRDQIMRPDPPVQASVYLETQQIPNPDPTEIFLANPDLVRELTANPLTTNDGESVVNLDNVTKTPEPTNEENLTATVTETPNPAELECKLPDGWISYVVQVGDTLFSLADSLNVETDQLRLVNCLNSDTLAAGQVIFLPSYPVIPSATPTRIPTRTATIRYYTATRTPTFTATPTRIPETNTSTPNPTSTIAPTSTLTSIPTNTIVPTPTQTETSIPTPTPTYTNTPNPTATPTNTPPPTDTPYPIATSTNWPTVGVTPVQ